jgi:hypothetical protein
MSANVGALVSMVSKPHGVVVVVASAYTLYEDAGRQNCFCSSKENSSGGM